MRRLRTPLSIAAILVCVAMPARGGVGPTLAATAGQDREVSGKLAGVLRLWDTSWWITVDAARGESPLARIEYEARFVDARDTRSTVGGIDVPDPDRARGRLLVTCATQRDYEQKLRVRLRARDTAGTAGDWVEVIFPLPVDSDPAAPPDAAVEPVAAAPETERRSETIGQVEVTVGYDKTIDEAKTALLQKARAQGADAVVGLRLVNSSGSGATFAADAVRYLDVAPAATPALHAGSRDDQVLGEITMPVGRR